MMDTCMLDATFVNKIVETSLLSDIEEKYLV